MIITFLCADNDRKYTKCATITIINNQSNESIYTYIYIVQCNYETQIQLTVIDEPAK